MPIRRAPGAHARRKHPTPAEEHLRALGAQAPETPISVYGPIAHERAVRTVHVGFVVLLVVVVVVLVGVQWFRPVPAPAFRSVVPATMHVPGGPLPLPWPATGAAALAVVGDGSLGSSGPTQPVPVAGLAKVMTAYVVLKDHPIGAGQDGATITVGPEALAAYQAEKADQETTIPLAAGETLTELQGLQGVLVASGNDMAVLLAQWDAGTTAAFVAKMNAYAGALGMTGARFTDPSGLDSGTVATPQDMVRLAQAAMALPAFGPIAAMPQVTLPMAGTVYNLDFDLGRDGIVGIKTGASAAAGGCFLFAARQNVAGQTLTIIGVVLGQRATPETGAAVDGADQLVKATFAAAAPLVPIAGRLTVGRVTTAWGASVPLSATTSSTVVAWPAMAVPAQVRMRRIPSSFGAGAQLGVLQVSVDGRRLQVPIRASVAMGGPSVIWRLTRL